MCVGASVYMYGGLVWGELVCVGGIMCMEKATFNNRW